MAEQALVLSEQEYKLAKERTVAIVDRDAEQYLTPLGISPEYFVQATLQAFHKAPGLIKADKESFAMALLKCAQRGLIPDGESACLVPYGSEVAMIVMYGGMLDICRRNMPGVGFESSTVWKWEKFELAKGDDGKLTHIPKPLPDDLDPRKAYKQWSNIVGSYTVITLPPIMPGAMPVKERHWLFRSEIERYRSYSRGWKHPSSPWQQHPQKMCEKTSLRRALGRMPSRSQIFAAVQAGVFDDYQHQTVAPQTRPAVALRPPPKLLI